MRKLLHFALNARALSGNSPRPRHPFYPKWPPMSDARSLQVAGLRAHDASVLRGSNLKYQNQSSSDFMCRMDTGRQLSRHIGFSQNLRSGNMNISWKSQLSLAKENWCRTALSAHAKCILRNCEFVLNEE